MKAKTTGILVLSILNILSLCGCSSGKKVASSSSETPFVVSKTTGTKISYESESEEISTSSSEKISTSSSEEDKKEYNVTYMDELGNTLGSESVKEGEKASFSNITFKTNNGAGYYTQFKAWDKDKNMLITEDTTFTCSYYKLPYDSSVSSGVIKYHGSVKEVTFPEKWNGYDVTTLGDFNYTMNSKSAKTYITKVHVPDSVTTVSGSCFFNCSKLSTLDGNNITTIGANSFYGCSSLTQIDLSHLTSAIGDYAFSGCSLLSVSELPGVDIGSNAFYNCSRITNLKISEGTLTISDDAFNCSGLKTVYFPDSLTSIGDYALIGCSITSACIGKQLVSIGSSNFDTTTKIYYRGTYDDFSKVTLGDANRHFTTDYVYFYSEEEPSSTDYKYFHFDTDGNIAEW